MLDDHLQQLNSSSVKCANLTSAIRLCVQQEPGLMALFIATWQCVGETVKFGGAALLGVFSSQSKYLKTF